jgi:hypothetical protein
VTVSRRSALLIDLNIRSEDLFIKCNNVKGEQKGGPAPAVVGRLLADDPALRVGQDDVEQFLKAAYQLRNAEIHDDHPVQKATTLPNGALTDDLAVFIEDLAPPPGRAIHLVLVELTRPLNGLQS